VRTLYEWKLAHPEFAQTLEHPTLASEQDARSL
jgi:hypothetical protein